MKLELVHADTCLADFWPGHHKAHVQIPVYHGMTLREIKDALRYEIQSGAIMGSDDLARLLSAHVVRPEEEKLADRAVRAAYAAVNRLKPARKGQKKVFPRPGRNRRKRRMRICLLCFRGNLRGPTTRSPAGLLIVRLR